MNPIYIFLIICFIEKAISKIKSYLESKKAGKYNAPEILKKISEKRESISKIKKIIDQLSQ